MNKASKTPIEMIPCRLIEIPEFSFRPGLSRRKGRYHGSIFPEVKRFGIKRWVFCCYIAVDNLKERRAKDMLDKEILEGCIAFLNQPPARKKFQKKQKKPIFGTLNSSPVSWSWNEQKKCFSVLLVTDDNKNRNLWGRGLSLNETRKERKRKNRRDAKETLVEST